MFEPPEEQTVLRLSLDFPSEAPKLASPSLSLTPVAARGLTGDRRYAYIDRAAPNVLRQARTLFWEEPPPVALGRMLGDGLRARFASVADAGLLTRADERLLVRLDRFEELTGAGQLGEAIVAFDVTVVDVQDQRPWPIRRYCATTPIAGPSPSERAAAFTSAMRSSIDQLAQDLAVGGTSVPSC